MECLSAVLSGLLAPLVLRGHKDIRLSQLLRTNGIPSQLAASLLLERMFLNSEIAVQLRLHVRAQHRYAGRPPSVAATSHKRLEKRALLNINNSFR